MHEQTHVTIFQGYGIESHVEYFSDFPNLITYPEEPCPDVACELAHNNSDSFMYPMSVIYLIFCFGFYIFILAIEELTDVVRRTN